MADEQPSTQGTSMTASDVLPTLECPNVSASECRVLAALRHTMPSHLSGGHNDIRATGLDPTRPFDFLTSSHSNDPAKCFSSSRIERMPLLIAC